MDCSPPGSSVQGILQGGILEWVAISFPRDLPDPGIELTCPALDGGFFTTEPPGQPRAGLAKSQSTVESVQVLPKDVVVIQK